MSQDAQPPPELPDDRGWSRDMHRSALARKGADGACEACGADAWGLSDRLLLMQALEPTGGLVPGQGVEVVSVFCKNCGLMRLHAATLLLRD